MIFATARARARGQLCDDPRALGLMMAQWRNTGLKDEDIDVKLLKDSGTRWPRDVEVCNHPGCQRSLFTPEGAPAPHCPRHGEQVGLRMAMYVIPVDGCFRYWLGDLIGPCLVWRKRRRFITAYRRQRRRREAGQR